MYIFLIISLTIHITLLTIIQPVENNKKGLKPEVLTIQLGNHIQGNSTKIKKNHIEIKDSNEPKQKSFTKGKAGNNIKKQDILETSKQNSKKGSLLANKRISEHKERYGQVLSSWYTNIVYESLITEIKSLGLNGSVDLIITLDKNGKISHPEILTSSGNLFLDDIILNHSMKITNKTAPKPPQIFFKDFNTDNYVINIKF